MRVEKPAIHRFEATGTPYRKVDVDLDAVRLTPFARLHDSGEAELYEATMVLDKPRLNYRGLTLEQVAKVYLLWITQVIVEREEAA